MFLNDQNCVGISERWPGIREITIGCKIYLRSEKMRISASVETSKHYRLLIQFRSDGKISFEDVMVKLWL